MEYKTHIKLVHGLYGTCFLYSIMRGIKNQPYDSSSYSDNALRLLVLVAGISYWGLQVTSSFSIWGFRFEGLFCERYVLKGQVTFEGH